MKKIFRILLVVLAMLSVMTTVVSASAPYTTYTYSASGFVLDSPDAYVPDVIVDADYIGVDMFGNHMPITAPRDIAIGVDEKVYLSNSGEHCIYVLDKYYKYQSKITEFVNEQGVPDGLGSVAGLFVNEEYIYACDPDNNRIVIFKLDGEFVKTVGKPESSLFDPDSIYKPIAVAVDSYGRMFIVSSTNYEGVIVMGDGGEFYGYIGAQKVALSAWDIFWRTFNPSDSSREEAISTEYNNITIDDKNFVYVTTSSIDEGTQQSALEGKDTSGKYAPVKKLNASGMDVMNRNGFYPPSGEVKVSSSKTSKITGASTIVDVAVGPQKTWSIIDQKRSRVFTYDFNGNLLFAFGDSGNQRGSISTVQAIAYQGDSMIMLDSENSSFTVYRRTEYGDILIGALENQNSRNYDAEVDDWKEILKRNNNFDVAYIGIAEAMYRDGDYDGAMKYFKSAYDKTGYSKAYHEVRKEWISKYFIVIPIVLIAIIVGIAKFLGYAGKKNKATSLKVGQKNIKEELMYAFHLMFHPFDGFWDLKHEKRGSPRSAFIILIVTVLSFLYQTVGTGYIFSSDTEANVFGTLTSVVVPVFLWVISNWCLTTLFDGEGSFADVFTATCYSLIPLPIFVIPATLLSNVLIAGESSITSMLTNIGMIWMALLLIFGTMITHGYSMGKNFLTIVGTIIGMMFIMLITMLFATLTTKVVDFIVNIVDEIHYRT